METKVKCHGNPIEELLSPWRLVIVHEYFNCWMLLNLQSDPSGNPMDLQSFHPYMEDIRRELTFKDEIALKADMFLDNIWQQNRPRLVTFVGVHVRGHEYQ